MSERFRGFLPVVIDLETGGFNAATDALLELAAVLLRFDGDRLVPDRTLHHQVTPFAGANIEKASLDVTGIDPFAHDRGAIDEGEALSALYREVRRTLREEGCNRGILVAHNAAFDQQFLQRATERAGVKRNPFHPFSFIDTASLAAVTLGHTVLGKACELAGIEFDSRDAHSARYDAEKTAELFCLIVNRWRALGGWPPGGSAPP